MPLRSWTFWWTASIKLTLCSHFHIFFFFHPLWFPHLSLILTSKLWLGFQSENQTQESREGDDEGAITRDSVRREAHGQTDNRVWRCHSPYSITCSLALYILFEGRAECPSTHPHGGVLQWGGVESNDLRADWKLSKVTVTCKTMQHMCGRNMKQEGFLILLFVFPQNTSYFKFTVRTYAQTHTLTLLDNFRTNMSTLQQVFCSAEHDVT